MKPLLILIVSISLLQNQATAQYNRFIVRLKDKGATDFILADPAPYLSQRAIDRRTRYAIPLDSTDLPVPASYISQIEAIPGVSLLNSSRWLNAVIILCTDPDALAEVEALPFVAGTGGVAARSGIVPGNRYSEEVTPLSRTAGQQDGEADYFDYGNNSFAEIHLHQGEFLHNIGLRGQGMQIAMLDGGFFNYTSLKAFDSVNANNQVLGTWDFVARNTSVVEDNSHGMMCFSTIAANIPGQFIGKAPKADFYLFRTEDVSSEYPVEEFNWACGAERADSSGADIISSSLGYGYDFSSPVADYPYSDLNGDITMSARAADLAAAKGLLVFNAAGNSGNDSWHYITTPADGDSVVAVGAVNTSGAVGAFSSYGPSPDGRIKPDIASVGVTAMVQSTGNTIGFANGTSFACPNMAGLSTCLWQGFPEFSNMQIVQVLKEAGDRYTTPDDRTGYGIPDMKKAFSELLTEFATASAELNSCSATVSWTSKDVAAMLYEIERKAPGETGYTTVATVSPQAGAVLSTHNYQLDNSLQELPAGPVWYRIRQIIDTAQASYTAVYIDSAAITISNPCITEPVPLTDKILIAPNPAVNSSAASLIIETTAAVSNLVVMMYDIKGVLVWQRKTSKAAGQYVMPLPAAELASGKYIIHVYDNTRLIGKTTLLKL